MRANCCSWKCFATGLLISTLLFITIAMIGGLVAIPVIYVHCPKDHHQYSVVYAAEPHYANVYLYRWDSRNTATLDHPYYTCHIPDIDTNSDGINAKLDHCLNLLVCSTDNNNKHCMPEWSKESVVMYFVATKELYSLHNSDINDYEDWAKQYGEHIASTLYKFFNHRNVTHYMILNESMESVATWITANTKHLQNPNQYTSTNGVLYLGVASVQLSHMTTTDKHSTHLSLYGRNYSIYSDTRCCKGVDELWKIIAVNNLGGDHGDSPINNPCLPQAYRWTVNDSELSSPCTNRSTEGMQFTFKAKDGDTYRQCEQQIDSWISQASSYASGDYIAFGQFIEIMNFFNTTTLNSSTGWSTYNDTLDKFCQSSLASLKALYKEVDDDQLSRRCYDGLLVRLLLMKAYGFTEGKNWSIDFSQINGTNSSTWSLGFMMEQTQQIQSTGPHKDRPYSLTSLILSLVELVILLVLFSLFLISVIHVSCSDRNKSGYIAIS